MLRWVKQGAVEFIYPRTCAGCNLRGTWLCDLCAESVPAIDGDWVCDRCGVPLVKQMCGCRQLHPNLVTVRSALPYAGWVRSAVHRMKYQDESARAAHLGGYLTPIIASFGPVNGVIPVPLHSRKLRDRGYNQAELIATQVGRELGIPVLPMIARHRQTRSQVGLSGAERLRNVEDAFSLDPGFLPPHDARYVIVDDVRTTAATLNGCVTALASAGVTAAHAATVAVDLRDDQLAVVMAQGNRSGS